MYTKRQILKATKILVQQGLIKYPTNEVEEIDIKAKLVELIKSMC